MALGLLVAPPAAARQTVTLWFWGAQPSLRAVLQRALVGPFHDSQNKYDLKVEYRNSVDSDVRIAVIADQGPDLIFTSGPSYIGTFAKAGKLLPLEGYARKYGWRDRLLAPVLHTCDQLGHLYCVTPSLVTDGMFYNKAVLAKYGWKTPRTRADIEAIMRSAQAHGLYASVTGNKGWQPVNEDYSSLFINGVAGPDLLHDVLTGKTRWDNPRMRQALAVSSQWFRAGYLGGKDYFSLNFDQSFSLLHAGRAPFFFAPTLAFQWAPTYFKGPEGDDLGFAAFPRMSADTPYPLYDIGAGFTLSISASSKVPDGAAAVLDFILSARFQRAISRDWPGDWSIPLKDFPDDPGAVGVARTCYATMRQVIAAIGAGHYGYKLQTFLPPATDEVFIEDIESVWLGQMQPAEMLRNADRAYARDRQRHLLQAIPPQAAIPARAP